MENLITCPYCGEIIKKWNGQHLKNCKEFKIFIEKHKDEVYKRYYEIMFQLCECGLFSGLAHPDSIKCFGYKPNIELTELLQY